MPQNKRYTFTFAFTFDGKVESRFIADLVPLNEAKLQKLGYEIDHSKTDGGKWLYACTESGRLLSLEEVAKVTHQELLHYQLNKVTVRLRNTLLPAPDQKQERLGDFKYRNGDWVESYKSMPYSFHADFSSRYVTVMVELKGGQNPKELGADLIYVLKSAQHSAFLASRVKELSYAMSGAETDEAFIIAAQGKLMAAIAFRLV
jgi:hypothetical protein